MAIRDEKEVVYQRVWYHHLPYTVVDVGIWHQVSYFRVPSGRFDYAMFLDINEVIGDGEAKTLMTDKRDIGRFVARIIKDPRTLNQKVFTWSDEISQNEILNMIEKKTGEKVQFNHVCNQSLFPSLAILTCLIGLKTTTPRHNRQSPSRTLRRSREQNGIHDA